MSLNSFVTVMKTIIVTLMKTIIDVKSMIQIIPMKKITLNDSIMH